MYPSLSQLAAPVSVYVQRTNDDYVGAVEVTPSDTVDGFTSVEYVRALVVTVTGVVKVTMFDGTTATIPMVAGQVYKVVVGRVWATGTNATGIVGLY